MAGISASDRDQAADKEANDKDDDFCPSGVLRNHSYTNWVEAVESLAVLQQGLAPFVDREIYNKHKQFLNKIPSRNQGTSSCGCTFQNILPDHDIRTCCIQKCLCKEKSRRRRKCPQNYCSTFLQMILNEHKTGDSLWKNSDINCWPTDHWSVAKCYMTTPTPSNSAQTTDVSELLSVIINGRFFQSSVASGLGQPCDAFRKARDVRRDIFHRAKMELTDAELQDVINTFVAVLKDPASLLHDPGAALAVRRLESLRNDQQIITTEEDTRMIDERMEALEKLIEEVKETETEAEKSLDGKIKRTLNDLCKLQDATIQKVQDTTSGALIQNIPVKPELILPVKILRKDEGSIKLYQKAMSEEKEAVHCIRIMVVGFYGVGKTTLTKRQLGENVDIDKCDSTDGINVNVGKCKMDKDTGSWTLVNKDKTRHRGNQRLANVVRKTLNEVPEPNKGFQAFAEREECEVEPGSVEEKLQEDLEKGKVSPENKDIHSPKPGPSTSDVQYNKRFIKWDEDIPSSESRPSTNDVHDNKRFKKWEEDASEVRLRTDLQINTMSRQSRAQMILLLVLLVFQAGGSLNCKEDPCSCCRTGSCADPHLSVLPCYGCIDGYCGPSCYEPCPASCVNCSQLFYEEETERVCSHCITGFYNGRYKDIGTYPLQQDCSLNCVKNCLQCTSYYNCIQCKPQYYLAYGKECLKCVEKCDQCTSRTDCIACEDGHVWNGEICEACEEGYFGTNCLKRCPDTCKSNTCHKSTGLCEACKNGYFLNDEKSCLKCPDRCNGCLSNESCVNCSAGYMGNTCNVECSSCKSGTACDKSTGHCFDSCRNGFSGKDCNLPCNSECFSCDRNKPSNCVTCASGRYGKTCKNECSNNCVNNSCSETDGECMLGCKNGSWGDNCEHSCSNDCIDETCERRNGSCLKLCIDNPDRKKCICPGNCECDTDNHCARCLHGSGEFCDTPCSEGCVNDTCNRTTGECLHGCLSGFDGSHCFSDRSVEDLRNSGSGKGSAVILVLSLVVTGLVVIAAIPILFLCRSRLRECPWFGFKALRLDFWNPEIPVLRVNHNRASMVKNREAKDGSELLKKKTATDTSSKDETPTPCNDRVVITPLGDEQENVSDRIVGMDTIISDEKQDTLGERVHFDSGDSGYSSEGVSRPEISGSDVDTMV